MRRALLFLSLVMSTALANAEIFKWVDDQGRVHYGDKPVVDSETIVVDIEKKGNLNTGSSREEKRQKLLSAMEEDKTRDQQEKNKSKEMRQKLERGCILYKDRLKRMESASYLYGLDAGGNRVIASNEERNKQTEQLRKDIQKNCK